jgi:hypothetical protein
MGLLYNLTLSPAELQTVYHLGSATVKRSRCPLIPPSRDGI